MRRPWRREKKFQTEHPQARVVMAVAVAVAGQEGGWGGCERRGGCERVCPTTARLGDTAEEEDGWRPPDQPIQPSTMPRPPPPPAIAGPLQAKCRVCAVLASVSSCRDEGREAFTNLAFRRGILLLAGVSALLTTSMGSCRQQRGVKWDRLYSKAAPPARAAEGKSGDCAGA